MKCASCGYYNLPGATVCGSCAKPLSGTNGRAPAAPEPFYPPRAKHRTMAEKIEVGLGRPFRQSRAGLQNARRQGTDAVSLARSQARGAVGSARGAMDAARHELRPGRFSLQPEQIWEETRAGMIASASIIPGLGQAIQGRYGAGAAFAAGSVVLAALTVATYRLFCSDVLAIALVGLICFSVWDAARHAFPAMGDDYVRRDLRLLRLAFLSATIVLGTLFTMLAFASQSYPMYSLRIDMGRQFRSGDTLIVHRLTNPIRQLRRGDILMATNNQGYPIVERVLGMPGDQIENKDGAMWVDGKPLTDAQLPLTYNVTSAAYARAGQYQYGAARPIFSALPPLTLVPQNQVCVWFVPAGQYEGEGYLSTFNRLMMVHPEDIVGKAVAVAEPPAHRRVLR